MSALAITPGLITHATAFATANGAIAQSAVTGGTGSYTSYSWSSSGATAISAAGSLNAALAAKSSLLPGRYTLTIADSASATASYVYDVSYVSPIAAGYIVQLASGEAATSDYFGYSTAVDGQFMVVGAPNKTQNQASAGVAYIFRRSDTSVTGTYTFEYRLVSDITGASYSFGEAVAISGDTVVVGEQGGGTSGSGKVYVWFRTAGTTTWTKQGPLVPLDPTGGDTFGSSVAIDGDYIAVGAPFWDQKTPTSILNCGAAYVFFRTGTTWSQQTPKLLAGDPTASDQLGISIAISGSTVVVGANAWDRKTPSSIDACGAAYVFTRSGTTWSQQTQLTATDPGVLDQFGRSVSISGDYIAVSALTWDFKAPAISDCGCVYVFSRTGTTWAQQAQLTAGDNGSSVQLGKAVSIHSSYLIAGADGRSTSAGCAYLYKRSGTNWFLVKLLTASDAASSDYFGCSVDVSDKYVVVGANHWEGALADQGAAYSTVLPEVVFTVTAGAITRGNFGAVNTCAIGAPAVTGGSGSYTYSWSTGQTTAAISGISPGTYVLTTTDVTTSDYAVTNYVVTTYAQITVAPGLITHATGPTSATGAIALSAVAGGGTGSYTSYAWTSSGAPATSTPTTLAAKSALLPGQYTLTVTDSNGGTGFYVYDVSYVSAIASTYRVVADVAAADDYFGYSCAVDGQYLVAGAYKRTQTQTAAGLVYLFVRSGTTDTGTYAFQRTFVSGTTGQNFNYGKAVAIGGDTVVIGQPGGSTNDRGCVYVWFRSGGTTWVQQASALTPFPNAAYDSVGSAVAIDGDYFVVGGANRAFVYFRSESSWSQQTRLSVLDPSSGDEYGSSVSISGSTAVIGARSWSQKPPLAAVAACGCSYVFVRSGTTWSQQFQLVASDPTAGDLVQSVSVSGNYAAVGSFLWDRKTRYVSDSGCVYIFSRQGTTWTQQAQLTSGDDIASDGFGFSVALNSTCLVVGAAQKNAAPNIKLAGSAYLYSRGETGAWTLNCKYMDESPTASSYLGFSVAITNNRYVALGAYSKTVTQSSQGAVFTAAVALPVIITGGAITHVAINGQATGAIGQVTASGGTGSYVSYSWSSSGGGSTGLVADLNAHTGLKAGTYTLLVTDSGGTTGTAVYVVTQNPVISYTGGSITNGQISALVVAGGSGTGYTFSWSGPYAVPSPTANGAKTGLRAGTYSCLIGDSVGATLTASFVITENAVLSYTGGVITHVSVNGQATGAIGQVTVVGGTGSYVSYSWSSSGGGTTGLAADSNAHTGLKAGTYTLSVTDTGGGTGSFAFVVTENPVISHTGGAVTNVAVNGQATGAIAALVVTGGSGTGYTYSWSGTYAVANPTVNAAKTGLRAGSYSCLITDSLGATRTASFVITENAVVSYTGGAITPPSSTTASDGAIAAITLAGGTGAYPTISWSNSGAGSTSLAGVTSLTAKTALKTGVYTLSAVDSAGATLTKAFDVFSPIRVATGGAITTAVAGGSNGKIAALTVTGGSGSFSYSWTSSGAGATTITAQSLSQKTGLAAGTYTLLVTDSSARTATFVFVVGTTPVLVVTRGAVTHCTVYSASDGAVAPCVVSGGLGATTLSWTSSDGSDVSGVSVNSLSKLSAGTYVLTVTDTQGTQAFQSFAVGQPIFVTATSTNQTRSTSGSVTLTAKGGLGAFGYAWTKNGVAFTGTGAGTATITGLTPAIYSCTVTTSLFSAVVTAGVGTYMTMSASATLLNAAWEPVGGATSYTVQYRKTGDADYSTFLNKSSALSVVIPTLTPSTEYEVRVLADVGTAASAVYYFDTITTLSPAAGFTKPSLASGATYDIRSVQASPDVNLTTVLESIFEAGDAVTFRANVRGSIVNIQGKVAKRDLAFDVYRGLTLFIPFDSTDAATQTAVLKLSDGSTTTLVYSSEDNALVLGGISYVGGSVFFIDGLKVTVGET